MLLTPSEVVSIIPEVETPPIDDEVELAWEKYRLAYLRHQSVKNGCQYSKPSDEAIQAMKDAWAEALLALFEYFETLDAYQAAVPGNVIEDVPFMPVVPPLVIPPKRVLPPYLGSVGTGPEDCWLCGRPGMIKCGDTLQCVSCDITWSKCGTSTTQAVSGTIWQNGVPLVEIDFTQPGAPVSPG